MAAMPQPWFAMTRYRTFAFVFAALGAATLATAQEIPADPMPRSRSQSVRTPLYGDSPAATPRETDSMRRYLELQEKYARGLSEAELTNRAVELEQQVRNQQVAREIDKVEDQMRRLLGDAVGSPSEQTVKDLLQVLEARHSVPKGQQVYFEKRYRSAGGASGRVVSSPTSRSTARPIVRESQPTRSAPTYSTPTYSTPSYQQPTYRRIETTPSYGF